MSHVDEGELTAYADGAYRVDDPVALRIGEHLSTCDNCRTRLELAHALRDRAQAILSYATPARVTAPAFETLEAQIAPPPRKPHGGFPLAWAASILLALGLGWFGRGFWQNPPALRDAAPPAAAVAQTESRAAPPTVAQAETDARVSGPAPASANTPAPAPSHAPQPAPAGLGARRAANDAVRDRVAVGAAESGIEAGRASAAATGGAEHITAAEAERRGLEIPRVPELAIARVVLRGDTSEVIQSLPDGTLVTLTVTPDLDAAALQQRARVEAAAPPAAAAPQLSKTAEAQPVMVRVRGKVVQVSGGLSADSLRALAARIR